jgi:hypothetical protein
VLAQCLRRVLGEGGEFAITAFGGHGLLWADNRSWEIRPLAREDVDEEHAATAFCTAWVVARRLGGATAGQALAYARGMAAAAAMPTRASSAKRDSCGTDAMKPFGAPSEGADERKAGATSGARRVQ